MAALGSQSIASSYEQLLHVDADGGGNGTTHVSVKDGDNGTTFGFTIATDALMMTGTNRLEFGDTGTYIHQSADGVLDLVSDTELELNATTIDMNGAVEISGNLGVGVTASQALHVHSNTPVIRISDADSSSLATATPHIEFYDRADTNQLGVIGYLSTGDGILSVNNKNNASMVFSTNNTTALTIDNAQTSTFAGKCVIPEKLEHTGDDDTFIRFTDDAINFSAGNTTPLVLNPTTGAAGAILNGKVMIGDTANANQTTGLTVNMGAADNEALTLKSSDVDHNRTDYSETDTWFNMKKTSNASGGAQLIANAEDAGLNYVLSLTASGGQADTTKNGSAHGLVKIWSEEHNGSNTIANITANGNIFAVSGYVGGANTTVFLVDEDGDIHYDGSDAGAYDYAEMFEWEDGNPDNEDRVGYSVSLVGKKIKKAEEGETVIGIVSAVPAVCGDSPMEWQKRYKTDEWGRKIHKEVDCVKFEIQHESEPAEYYEENDDIPEGKEVGDVKKEAVYITKEKHYEGDGIPSELPDNAVTYKKLISQNSDEYDPSQEFIPRKERKEWSPVGLVGKLRMRKGQPTSSSWIKMEDEGNDIEMWFIK
jgi:hypothetical protein